MKKFIKLICMVLCFTMLFSFGGCSLFGGGASTFVYQNEDGTLYATLTVDFDAGTYTYEGNDFYSESSGYIMRQGTSYKVSSTIYYVKEVNNEKYYSFHDHPWNHKYYFVLSEDGQMIRSGIMGTYKFYKQ